MIMVGRDPIATLFLNMPPEDSDVNVHPTKAEIRFRDPNYCFKSCSEATRRALITYSSYPDVSAKMWQMNTNVDQSLTGQELIEWSGGNNHEVSILNNKNLKLQMRFQIR